MYIYIFKTIMEIKSIVFTLSIYYWHKLRISRGKFVARCSEFARQCSEKRKEWFKAV